LISRRVKIPGLARSTAKKVAPFHNWNERILAECYRANGFARIIDSNGRVERIVK
jgi:hypothetical protein